MYNEPTQTPPLPNAPLPQTAQMAGGMAQQPWATKSFSFPFIRREGRTYKKDRFSPFRTGEIVLTEQGVQIRGKAVMADANMGYLLFGAVGALIAENMRKQQEYWFAWELIERIILEPNKQRACIAYQDPKAPKQVLALAFALGDRYGEFAQAAKTLAPTKTTEGKILVTNVLVVLAVVFIAIILVIGIALVMPSRH